jgi:hypothetical protein
MGSTALVGSPTDYGKLLAGETEKWAKGGEVLGRKAGLNRKSPAGYDSMSDPKIIYSALSRTVREGGTEVRIDIYRLVTTDWSLEVIDETGASTVWDELFTSDQAALDEAMKTIREEGIRTFLTGGRRVIH